MQWIKKYRSWFWVSIFVLMIHLTGKSLVHQRRLESQASFSKIEQLNKSIKLAKERKEELSREIESFQDPLWLQEVVKEELGLVRQKETKIIFRSE
jgi:cell division protein FtsB